jgi:putative membrane protein
MLYLKVFHLVAIISWMAGIFYLPRIFVHYVEGQTAGEDVRRLVIMARKLYHFTSGMAVFSLLSGASLWYWQAKLGYVFSGWIHVKLLGVAALIAYHISMRVLLKRLQRGAPMPGSTTLRWYNELPLAMLVVILWMVVLKPF